MSQQINLLSPDLRRKRERVSATHVALLTVVAVLIVLSVAVWTRKEAELSAQSAEEQESKLKALKEQIAAAGKELLARKPNERLLVELAGARSQLEGRQEVMKYLEHGGLASADGFAQFLHGLARQTVNGVWLTGFSVNEGGHDMELRGRALQAALLPDYIRRLNGEAVFRGRSFASIDVHRADGDKPAPEGAGRNALPRFVEFVLLGTAVGAAPAAATLAPPSNAAAADAATVDLAARTLGAAKLSENKP